MKRSVDSLAAMLRRGAITEEMHAAGVRLRRSVEIAQLDPLRAGWAVAQRIDSSSRLPPASGRLPEQIAAARQLVASAIADVGGLDTAPGACLWHVVGCGRTLKDWALNEGWSGRKVSQEVATGIMVGALGTLARHFR